MVMDPHQAEDNSNDGGSAGTDIKQLDISTEGSTKGPQYSQYDQWLVDFLRSNRSPDSLQRLCITKGAVFMLWCSSVTWCAHELGPRSFSFLPDIPTGAITSLSWSLAACRCKSDVVPHMLANLYKTAPLRICIDQCRRRLIRSQDLASSRKQIIVKHALWFIFLQCFINFFGIFWRYNRTNLCRVFHGQHLFKGEALLDQSDNGRMMCLFRMSKNKRYARSTFFSQWAWSNNTSGDSPLPQNPRTTSLPASLNIVHSINVCTCNWFSSFRIDLAITVQIQ